MEVVVEVEGWMEVVVECWRLKCEVELKVD